MTRRAHWREGLTSIGLGQLVEATENAPLAPDPARLTLVEAVELAWHELSEAYGVADLNAQADLHIAAANLFERAGEQDAEMRLRRRRAKLWRSELPGLAKAMLGR